MHKAVNLNYVASIGVDRFPERADRATLGRNRAEIPMAVAELRRSISMSLEASWRLPELMARAGYRRTSDLIEPLAARGIVLSRSQVYRLTREPDRVSLRVLAALCDIFCVGVEELIALSSPDAG